MSITETSRYHTYYDLIAEPGFEQWRKSHKIELAWVYQYPDTARAAFMRDRAIKSALNSSYGKFPYYAPTAVTSLWLSPDDNWKSNVKLLLAGV